MEYILKNKILLFILIFFIILSPICMATNTDIIATYTTNDLDTNNLSEDEVDNTNNSNFSYIPSDLYKFEENAEINEVVDGNLFVMANKITISGEIAGDVFALGNEINFTDTAYIHGSLFIIGQDVSVNCLCYDIYGIGTTFNLDENAVIARDVRIASDNININGRINKDAYLYTNNLLFANNDLEQIAGNLSYSSPSEFEISDGIVGGDIHFTPVSTDEPTIVETIIGCITNIVSALLYALFIVLLIIWLAPNFKDKAKNIIKNKAPLAFGTGLLSFICIILASISILFLLHGLSFGISVAAITTLILAYSISQTVFGLSCAKILMDKSKKEKNIYLILYTLLIVLVINILGLIPFIGFLVSLIVNMTGFGTIVLNLISKKDFSVNAQKSDK